MLDNLEIDYVYTGPKGKKWKSFAADLFSDNDVALVFEDFCAKHF